MRGLLGRSALEPGEGVVLRPASSIHTAFMRFPIDVVFLDHDQHVVRIDECLKPFRTASCRGAREVVELPARECAHRGLSVGDRVTWAPRAAEDDLRAGGSARLAAARGSVVVASRDLRFAKLARFLLEGEGIVGTRLVTPDRLSKAVEQAPPDVVVLDTEDELGRSLRLAQSISARSPNTSVLLVGDEVAARAPESARVYDKWEETTDVVFAVSVALDEPQPVVPIGA